MLTDDRDLGTKLTDLRRNIDELKARQRVGGASTLVQDNRTGSAYDYSASIAEFAHHTFTITFTADTQAYALSELMLEVFVGSPSTVASLHTDYYMTVWRLPQGADPLVTQWKAQVEAVKPGTNTFYLNATVMSTDTGTVS
jgi:hypothetical protein